MVFPISTFTGLQIRKDLKLGKANPRAMDVATKLDDYNKKSYGHSEGESINGNYRKTVINEGLNNWAKRLNSFS